MVWKPEDLVWKREYAIWKTEDLAWKPEYFIWKTKYFIWKTEYLVKNWLFCEDTRPICKKNRQFHKEKWLKNTFYVYEWEWKCEINWNTIWQCIFCLLYFKIECKIKYLHTKKCFSLVKFSLVLFFLHCTHDDVYSKRIKTSEHNGVSCESW